MYFKILYLIFTLIVLSEGARILAILPTPSISHQVVFRPLIHELVKRGHEVTIITPDPAYLKGEAPANLTEIDVHDISYTHWKKILKKVKENKDDILYQVKTTIKLLSSLLDIQFQTPEVQEILKKDRKYYDLILCEAYIRTAVGIVHVFDAPLVLFSSFGAISFYYGVFGAPVHPLLYPALGTQRAYDISTWEKAVELFKFAMLRYLISSSEEYDNYVMRKNFGQDIPPYGELRNKINMLLVNEHPIWGDNRPVPPNIKYIGGIHLKAPAKLPKDIKSYLDSSKHGVIYVSFGTNVEPSSVFSEKIIIMNKVFSKLPYDVLFKWDKEEMPGQSKNVKLFKWLSQSDVLKHPKIKLFITQGGLQSTDEAIDAGVPMIGIPILGDQWYNVEKYVHHKIGAKLSIETIDEIKFQETIAHIIGDESIEYDARNTQKFVGSVVRRRQLEHLLYKMAACSTNHAGLTLTFDSSFDICHIFDKSTMHDQNHPWITGGLADVLSTIKHYKKNIQRLRTLMREQPMKPLDVAVWWTEHIIKYGGDHLRSPAFNISWTDYYEVELITLVVSILIFLLVIIAIIVKSVIRFAYNICTAFYPGKNKLKTS